MNQTIRTYHWAKSQEVSIGDLVIGGDHPIAVQSMTNTDTMDTDATVSQVMRLADAGCDIVRITAPSMKEAENLDSIKKGLRKNGYHLPLVADIHFTPRPAEVAARMVEKVRINPGNYVDRNKGKVDWSELEIKMARERIAERLLPLLKICKEYGTTIRIGTNHGSLSERILSTYGNTALGMVESAMEFVRICEEFGFHDLVLSMKASQVREMHAANILLMEELIRSGRIYPIHLGVTEAGNGEEARIKSAAGIGRLLAMGIGDTVRVSLAEQPVKEVPVGRKLVQHYGRDPLVVKRVIEKAKSIQLDADQTFEELMGTSYPVVCRAENTEAELMPVSAQEMLLKGEGNRVSYQTLEKTGWPSASEKGQILRLDYEKLNNEDLLIRSSVDCSILLEGSKQNGIWIENGDVGSGDSLTRLSLKVLQALGLRYSETEFIACPTCGRTKFNLFDSFNKVKESTSHLKGLQIAVMGCIVNGPGEMGDAHYGYVGAGPGKVTIYKDGIAVLKNIDEGLALQNLVELIKESGDWMEPR